MQLPPKPTPDHTEPIHSGERLLRDHHDQYLASIQKLLDTQTDFAHRVAKGIGLVYFRDKKEEGEVCFAESQEVRPEYRLGFTSMDLLDYIYALLHSPWYRDTDQELFEIDFSQVTYRADADQFWNLVALGGELRQLHLMESPSLSQFITQFPVGGENEVQKISFVPSSRSRNHRSDLPDDTASSANANPAVLPGHSVQGDLTKQHQSVIGRVYINSEQFVDSVPEVAWNFYIGGVQPAQKWLKDRKGQVLDYKDIMHYQRTIKAIVEINRVMWQIAQIRIDG